jgi:hypothetical protein
MAGNCRCPNKSNCIHAKVNNLRWLSHSKASEVEVCLIKTSRVWYTVQQIKIKVVKFMEIVWMTSKLEQHPIYAEITTRPLFQ